MGTARAGEFAEALDSDRLTPPPGTKRPAVSSLAVPLYLSPVNRRASFAFLSMRDIHPVTFAFPARSESARAASQPLAVLRYQTGEAARRKTSFIG